LLLVRVEWISCLTLSFLFLFFTRLLNKWWLGRRRNFLCVCPSLSLFLSPRKGKWLPLLLLLLLLLSTYR
jgi:hypothetical protein